MPKKAKKNIYDEIVVIPNKDKLNHERWSEDRTTLNLPSPARVVIIASVNSGKTLLIQTLLDKQDPKFSRIFLMHVGTLHHSIDDPCKVDEYSLVDYIPIREIPDVSIFNDELYQNGVVKKQVLIVDDVNIKSLKKDDMQKFLRLITHVSTHCNLTIYIAVQNGFDQLPTVIPGLCSQCIIYKTNNQRYMSTIANRFGFGSKDELTALKSEMKGYGTHDFLLIDFRNDAIAKYRRNGKEPCLLELN